MMTLRQLRDSSDEFRLHPLLTQAVWLQTSARDQWRFIRANGLAHHAFLVNGANDTASMALAYFQAWRHGVSLPLPVRS